MKIIDVIVQRRSVRAYTDQPVERDKLERLLEAARLAPSASNRQEWRFIVVTDAERAQAARPGGQQPAVRRPGTRGDRRLRRA